VANRPDTGQNGHVRLCHSNTAISIMQQYFRRGRIRSRASAWPPEMSPTVNVIYRQISDESSIRQLLRKKLDQVLPCFKIYLKKKLDILSFCVGRRPDKLGKTSAQLAACKRRHWYSVALLYDEAKEQCSINAMFSTEKVRRANCLQCT